MKRVRIIEVDHFAYEVGTVSLHEVIALNVRLTIEFLDKPRILLGACLNREAVNGAVVG